MGAVVTAAVLAGSALGVSAADADSASTPKSTTVANKLVSPLSMAVAGNGTVYVSQNFAGLLTRKSPGRAPQVLFQAPKGTEVGAVSLGSGSLRFATTKGKKTMLWEYGGRTGPRKLANLWAHERKKNPDAHVQYGFEDIDPACAAQVPKQVPVSYSGIKESHPYGSAIRGRTTYVADAAGNTILKVNRKGKVSTVAVLPPVPVEITAEAAAAGKMPACTVGLTYLFEPVPTDVERGPDGKLYVSLLPGGPEDGSAGANGSVVSVKIRSGKVRTLATGFAGATGVARARNGDLFVAQLFGGQVSRVKKGTTVARTYDRVSMPAAVQWSRGHLYVTADVLAQKPKGKVLRY